MLSVAWNILGWISVTSCPVGGGVALNCARIIRRVRIVDPNNVKVESSILQKPRA